MSRKAYMTSIPAGAAEVVDSHHTSGAKKTASYFLTGEKVGYREWHEEGGLEFEYAMRNGVKHGNEFSFWQNGQLQEVQPYRDGQLHGVGKQWSETGQLLVTWELTDGVGMDLWCDILTGTLAEEHYWPQQGELGFTRHWNPDEMTISQEYYYVLGRGYHGVWREWNGQGKIRRGFPRYFVNDQKVSRRQYLKACQSDPTLPAYLPVDNQPGRELPAEYLAQRKKR